MADVLKPFHLLNHDNGKSSLFFMADAFYNAPIMVLLTEKTGIDRDYFNGHAWSNVVSLLIQSEFSEEALNISLDSEADMFSAISADHGLLERLALRLKEVFNDEKVLGHLLEK